MSEPKATTVYAAYWKANSTGEGTGIQIYLKSEADKVIKKLNEKLDLYKRGWAENDKVNAYLCAELRHQKYKRCLAMAKWCEERSARYDVLQERHNLDWGREIEFYYRWYMRWLELAEKFKEAK